MNPISRRVVKLHFRCQYYLGFLFVIGFFVLATDAYVRFPNGVPINGSSSTVDHLLVALVLAALGLLGGTLLTVTASWALKRFERLENQGDAAQESD
jgi:hypothetical protein